MYTSPVFDRMLKSEFREKHTNAIKMVGKDFGQVQDLMLHLHPGRRKSITGELFSTCTLKLKTVDCDVGSSNSNT